MGDARKHNTLFFGHNPADPTSVAFKKQIKQKPLRDIPRRLVMFKDCLKRCFHQLEKFNLFGFPTKELNCPKNLGNEIFLSKIAS